MDAERIALAKACVNAAYDGTLGRWQRIDVSRTHVLRQHSRRKAVTANNAQDRRFIRISYLAMSGSLMSVYRHQRKFVEPRLFGRS